MNPDAGRRFAPFLVGLLLLLASVGVILTRLDLSYDLGLFLPPATNAEQRVLLERLGESPGSRYIFVAAGDSNSDETLESAAARLAAGPHFERVVTDLSTLEMDAVPDPLWTYRYLLTDTDFSAPTLAAALGERAAELSLFGGGTYSALIQADPTLSALAVFGEASATGQDDWRTNDGRRVLIAETRAPSFDLAAQEDALKFLKSELGAFADQPITVSGVGVFGVELRKTIHREAQLRSILATAAILIMLWAFYRRFYVLWLAAIPMGMAVCAGIACTALVFPQVHGITLAFGVTLVGIAIDYPLHLLSHARGNSSAQGLDQLWPTMRLGAASTVMAYVAVAISGSEGMAQLGLFTATGIAAALATTRWILPSLLPVRHPIPLSSNSLSSAPSQQGEALRPPALRHLHLGLLLVVAASCAAPRWTGSFWGDDLSKLSPVPEDKLLLDTQLRNAIGAPDLRYLIELRDEELPALLDRLQRLSDRLPEAVEAGYLQGFRSASTLLPAATKQRQRQAALPPRRELVQRLASGAAATPFPVSTFTPFLDAVDASRSLPLLTPDSYAGSALEGMLRQLVYRTDGEWVTIVALFEPRATEQITRWLAIQAPGSHLVDLKRASAELVAAYRSRTVCILATTLALILLLLLTQISRERALWSLATTASSVMAASLFLLALSGPLSLYHLIGLLLVAGLGLDYTLFLSRPADRGGSHDGRHAVWACASSTIAAFAIIGLSEIPALQALGTTIAMGTCTNVVAARLGLRFEKQE